MANGFQRIIYNLANAVPLMALTALVWYLELKTWGIPIILLTIAVVETVLFAIFFKSWKDKYAGKSINVSKMISKDSLIFTYVVVYLLPFAYMVMPDYHIVSLIVVVITLIFVFITAIMALPNILLFVAGYHFYELETESTGTGDYILISKRKRLRNKADVKTVIRVFEKLLIDSKGGI